MKTKSNQNSKSIVGNLCHHGNGRRSEAWFWRDSFRDHNIGMIVLIRKFHTWVRSVVYGGGLEGIYNATEVIMKLMCRKGDQVNTIVAKSYQTCQSKTFSLLFFYLWHRNLANIILFIYSICSFYWFFVLFIMSALIKSMYFT